MTETFSDEAKPLWDAVPQWAKEKLLSNVWCGQCRDMTTIISFPGEALRGNLILSGICHTCGGPVVKVLEKD